MRDYLFRGKRTDGKGWAFGSYVKADGKHYIFTGQTGLSQASPVHQLMYRDFVRYEVFPETVGQYSEADDKEGAKIFEDDIVLHPYQGGTVTQEIIFYDAAFHSVGVCNVIIGELSQRNIEVIGNIHDNPELLKAVSA
jgi:hypothetical protein